MYNACFCFFCLKTTRAGMTTSALEEPPSVCDKHNKGLELFCSDCEVVICSKCVSEQHRGHTVDDVDVAYREYKVQSQQTPTFA
jgi:hypothetical protein